MAVQPHRNTWTDERLDDLSQSIRDGFARNDADHLAFREDMRDMRAETREGFAAVDQRIDALQRTLIISMATLGAAIIASAATVASILG